MRQLITVARDESSKMLVSGLRLLFNSKLQSFMLLFECKCRSSSSECWLWVMTLLLKTSRFSLRLVMSSTDGDSQHLVDLGRELGKTFHYFRTSGIAQQSLKLCKNLSSCKNNRNDSCRENFVKLQWKFLSRSLCLRFYEAALWRLFCKKVVTWKKMLYGLNIITKHNEINASEQRRLEFENNGF